MLQLLADLWFEAVSKRASFYPLVNSPILSRLQAIFTQRHPVHVNVMNGVRIYEVPFIFSHSLKVSILQ